MLRARPGRGRRGVACSGGCPTDDPAWQGKSTTARQRLGQKPPRGAESLQNGSSGDEQSFPSLTPVNGH